MRLSSRARFALRSFFSILLLTGTLENAPSAIASDGPSFNGDASNGAEDIAAIINAPGADAPSGDGSKRMVEFVPSCTVNNPDGHASDWVMCPAAITYCDAVGKTGLAAYTRYIAEVGPPKGPWVASGTVCLDPKKVQGTAVPAFTLEDFRRLPLPPGAAHIQPEGTWVLVNVPTNVYVLAPRRTFATSLLGFPIRVRATAVQYRWTFGDGATMSTADAGGKYPDMTTTHVYRVKQRLQIGLATGYSGEYSVSGGPWMAIEGLAWVDSEPVPLEVIEAHPRLVADNVPR